MGPHRRQMHVLIGVGAAASAAETTKLDTTNWASSVEKSKEAWVVKFESKMCGSCQEFAPEFEKVKESLQESLRFGAVNIDDADGMKLAKKLGVLKEGIPNVKLIMDTKPTPILKADPAPASTVTKAIKKNLDGLSKSANGLFLKSGHTELQLHVQLEGAPSG